MIALTIKMSGTSTSFLSSFDIGFMNAESSFKFDSWTYILFQTFRTYYKIYNVKAFTVKLTSYKISLTSDCTNKGIIKNHIILANITIITTCNTAYSNVYFKDIKILQTLKYLSDLQDAANTSMPLIMPVSSDNLHPFTSFTIEIPKINLISLSKDILLNRTEHEHICYDTDPIIDGRL